MNTWHAFVVCESNGKTQVISTSNQRLLKHELSLLSELDKVVAVIRGKRFLTKIDLNYSFLDEPKIDKASQDPHVVLTVQDELVTSVS